MGELRAIHSLERRTRHQNVETGLGCISVVKSDCTSNEMLESGIGGAEPASVERSLCSCLGT